MSFEDKALCYIRGAETRGLIETAQDRLADLIANLRPALVPMSKENVRDKLREAIVITEAAFGNGCLAKDIGIRAVADLKDASNLNERDEFGQALGRLTDAKFRLEGKFL